MRGFIVLLYVELGIILFSPNIKVFADEHSVTADEVRHSHCHKTSRYGDHDISLALDQVIQDLPNLTPISESIYGIQIQNEHPFLVRSLAKLLTYTGGVDYQPNRKDCNKQESQKQFTTSCSTVRCSVDHLFGKKEGPRILLLMLKYGVNASHFHRKNTVAWKSSDLNDILIALSDLPSSSAPLFDNQAVLRVKDRCGPDTKNKSSFSQQSVVANAFGDVFKPWDDIPYQQIQLRYYYLIHEFAHMLGSRWGLDENPVWASFSGPLVSTYAEKSQKEDFAESVAAYRFAPSRLKSLNPMKYSFLKETIFNGLEYDYENNCADQHSFTAQEEQHLLNKATDYLRCSPKSLITQIHANCSGWIEPEQPKSMNVAYQRCANYILLNEVLGESPSDPTFEHPEFSRPILLERLARDWTWLQRFYAAPELN